MNCPTPIRTRTGDMECRACGRSWDIFDGKPHCSGDPRVRTALVAERELAKIRRILGVNRGIGELDSSTVG